MDRAARSVLIYAIPAHQMYNRSSSLHRLTDDVKYEVEKEREKHKYTYTHIISMQVLRFVAVFS